MKLTQWRKENGRTQAWVARQIRVDQTFVSRIERSIEPQMPNRDIMKAIYVLTRGAVQPNDFHDVPAWEAKRIAAEAEAELQRQAA